MYPDESIDYENIIASCIKDHKTCGFKKGNQYDENQFVSPHIGIVFVIDRRAI